MKIFVCSKNNLIFYAALIVVLAGLIGLRSSDNHRGCELEYAAFADLQR